MFKKTRLARAVQLASCTSVVVANVALAQDAPAPQMEETVITGSYIVNDAFSSVSPIDIIYADDALQSGIGGVGELLQSVSVASGSPQINAAVSTEFNVNGGLGVSTVSLRGLGAERTLTLLNGRRAGPSGIRGGVSSFDFNVIPLSAVERIEILKDGASSTYGSDAIAGAINIITKKADGGEVDAFIGQPTESGGEENRLSFTWGKTFERGNISATLDYHEQKELARGDRDWFACGEDYIFDVDSGERADRIDPRTGDARCSDLLWGHIWIYDYTGLPTGAKAQYDYDGDLASYIPGFDEIDGNFVAPEGWFPVNYDLTSDGVANADHPFQDQESLVPEQEITTFYLQGEYNLTDTTTAYSEVLLNRREGYINGYRQYWSYIYNGSFDFGGGSGNELSEGWGGVNWLSPTAITDINDRWATIDYQRLVLGLVGDIDVGNGVHWDLYYQASSSEADYGGDAIYNDAIRDQNWLYGSCEGTTLSVSGRDCVDIPWLDPDLMAGNFSQEIEDFLFTETESTTEYEQQAAQLVVSTDLFELPSGFVSGAIGASYQLDEINDTPDEIIVTGNVWGESTSGITEGEQETTSLFGELAVPVLSDLPMVQSLDLNLAARYTDVDTYGSDTTYRTGLNWAFNDQLRLRGAHSTSFRAPALFELFLADQVGFLAQSRIDPCINWESGLDAGSTSPIVAANCEAEGVPGDYNGSGGSANIISGGGLGVLEAETSTSNTIGLVWRPEWADLNISVDYFDITINDEVAQLGAGNILFGCYSSDFFPDEPLCDLFARDADIPNNIGTVRDSYINVNSQVNRGWDLEVLYRTTTPLGELTIETEHTFQIEDTTEIFDGTPIDSNGLLGDPKWTGNATAQLDYDDWSFFWGMDFVGESDSTDEFGSETATLRGEEIGIVLKTDDVVYHHLSMEKRWPEWQISARFGIRNVLNEAPPRITTLNLGEGNTVGSSAFYSQYDWIGRTAFLNFSYSFE